MSRRPLALAAAVALALVAASATASTASASPRLLKGIYDEAQTLYGNPDRTFPILQSLRTKALRVNLYWGGQFGVANRKPANPGNPNDPAYDWDIYDRTVNYAQQYGIKVVFSIWGTPGWANRFRGIRYAPASALELQKFAYAAARRYSGRWLAPDGRGLPRVDHWLAWNEPNNPAFLLPQYRMVGGRAVIWSAREYAKICNAVVRGVRAARIRAQKIACGVTAPRGNNSPNSVRSSVSPIAFLRAMKSAGAKGFDAYAHHPYYGHRAEKPLQKPRTKNAVTLGNIDTLIAEVTRRWGRKPIWITEYAYQTKPDRLFAVSPKLQAAYLRQAFLYAKKHPRIDMMLWFMLRDDTNIPVGWQSGLLTARGARKPAFTAFQRIG